MIKVLNKEKAFDNNLKDKIISLIKKEWGNTDFVIVKNKKFYLNNLSYIFEIDNDNVLGVLSYKINRKICEIITLNSFKVEVGIGSKLIEMIEQIAKKINVKKFVYVQQMII